MKKKIVAVVMVVILSLGLVACGEEFARDDKKDPNKPPPAFVMFK